MREVKRKPSEHARLSLVRGADGRLRPAAEDRDIAEIWADRDRIRLREAIEADKRKAERKARRRAFFSRKNKKPAEVAGAVTSSQPSGDKTIEVKIQMPKVNWGRLRGRLRAVRGHTAAINRKKLVVGVVIAMVVVGGYTALRLIAPDANKTASNATGVDGKQSTGTLGAQTPTFDTVLPSGKNIGQLGGWKRVSPIDREPVFAFTDRIGTVQISVSQQALPEGFKDNTPEKISNLASQFSANDKLLADATAVYVGTSIKGPQSVIFTKHGLLILIKSANKIPNDKWVAYVQSLQP